MARYIGHVVFQSDGNIKHMIFNGTVDQCYPKLYDTYDNAADAFMAGTGADEWPDCTCGESEPVIIIPYDSHQVDPAKTIHWHGTACRKCRCIETGLADPAQG